jgi:hypothetical protein
MQQSLQLRMMNIADDSHFYSKASGHTTKTDKTTRASEARHQKPRAYRATDSRRTADRSTGAERLASDTKQQIS